MVTSVLYRNDIGATGNSTDVIFKEHEALFRENGCNDSKTLQRTVFFYTGLHFLLHWIDEQHRFLPTLIVQYPSDISVYSEDVYYEYTEFI